MRVAPTVWVGVVIVCLSEQLEKWNCYFLRWGKFKETQVWEDGEGVW